MGHIQRLHSMVSSWASGPRPPPPAPPVVDPPPVLPVELPQHPPEHADVESGRLRSDPAAAGPRRTTEGATTKDDKKDPGKPAPPFHKRMSDSATSIASCLVALAFLLVLNAPSVPPPLLLVFCYFGMVTFLAGSCIYFLHVARPASPGTARVQATAAVIGLTAATMDGVVVCYLYLAPAQFWGLALAVLGSMVGFMGVAVWAAGCGDGDGPDI